jgi:hypothetical protein
MKSLCSRLCQAVAIMALACGFPLSGAGAAPGSMTPAPAYDFRIGFWSNLHHMLYAAAALPPGHRPDRLNLQPEDQAVLARLSERERVAWESAVDYYSTHFRTKDLLFDDEMIGIDEALGDTGDTAAPGANLPPGLASVLKSAAPIYRKYWWRSQRSADEAWRKNTAMLLDRYGSVLAAKLSRILSTPWPGKPVHVEVVSYANWAGAYTSLDPTLITIGAKDEANQGDAGLEVLLHETIHSLFRRVDDELNRITADVLSKPGANPAAVRRGLWHELLFYIAGRTVADELPGYVPYADRNGLWTRVMRGPDRRLMGKDIAPWVEGSATMGAALDALVTDLAASPTASDPRTPVRN